MSPLVVGCPCPKVGCLNFIVPGVHPLDKKSFDPVSNKWHLICQKCSTEFDVLVSDLKNETVSSEWMQQNYPR